jgi:hypothetical protein
MRYAVAEQVRACGVRGQDRPRAGLHLDGNFVVLVEVDATGVPRGFEEALDLSILACRVSTATTAAAAAAPANMQKVRAASAPHAWQRT